MKTRMAPITRHPLLSYAALTLVISWGGILIVARPGGMPGLPEQTARLLPFAYLAMLAGPAVAGLLATGLIDGRAGLRELLDRLRTWRVGARWYAVALLTLPLLALATLLALARSSPAFLPQIVTTDDKLALLRSGLAVGLGVGVFEELGWTGFAIPRLRRRYEVLTSGLIAGLVWGVWHIPLFFWLSGDAAGALSLPHFLPAVLFCGGVLPVVRVLMAWVYDRTASLLVVILMHMSLVGVSLTLIPLALVGLPLVTWYLVLLAALWAVVAAVAVANGGHLARRPLQTGVA